MKKFIAVAAILSVMFLGAGTSQALMGVPDAVPGEDILIPFFMVSMTGSDNSLITITDVNGVGAANCLHLRLYDVNSAEQYNEWIDMTAFDVYVTDALTLINNMSPLGRAALEVDLDGDTVNDHWVGYIHFESALVANDFIAHVYQVSVADGMVAGYTGVSMERAVLPFIADVRLEAYSGVPFAQFGGLEAFSAGSLLAGDQLLTAVAPAPAVQFRLLPRVYCADASSTNLLIIWTDVEAVPAVPAPGALHINFWDEDENAISSPINIPDELNFIDILDIYPAGLTNLAPAALIAGWIDIRTNVGDGIFDENRMWLGYSLQRAMMAGGTTLDVILEAHRDAN